MCEGVDAQWRRSGSVKTPRCRVLFGLGGKMAARSQLRCFPGTTSSGWGRLSLGLVGWVTKRFFVSADTLTQALVA
jgi:hypothetical protein